MKKTLPYILFATFLHGVCIALLAYSPVQKKSPKLLPFKEKFVILNESLSIVKTCTTTKPPTQQQVVKTEKKQPFPQEQPQKYPEIPSEKKKTNNVKLNKPVEKEKSILKSQTEDKASVKKKAEKDAKLKTIADLAKTLSKHLDDSDARLADISFPISRELAIHSSLAATQEEELCQLLRKYIVLPFSGEVRVKLVLTPQGNLQECVLLSEISEAEKQLILMRIHEIPFKKFLDKYKISKNIAFHIKLLSSES
ncbi:inclusion-associated protein [Chlamydia crocodili]|uniref:Inclusion-associated protein n=1 Tax=Chlamydia crocodili TaxID=2766982 RepID=A0ABX8CI17_9CHLA|nr:inclusion-associated protein [Chlamydia crocodili]QVE49495.1 inclusion-associated protein [Chlamydia crocodili]